MFFIYLFILNTRYYLYWNNYIDKKKTREQWCLIIIVSLYCRVFSKITSSSLILNWKQNLYPSFLFFGVTSPKIYIHHFFVSFYTAFAILWSILGLVRSTNGWCVSLIACSLLTPLHHLLNYYIYTEVCVLYVFSLYLLSF